MDPALTTTPDTPDDGLTTPIALKHKLDGMTYVQIGEMYGVTKQSVHARIKKVFSHLEEHLNGERVKSYEDNRDKILTVAKSIIVDELVNPDKIAKSSVNNLAYAYDKLDHAQRLVRGQVTEMVGISGVVNDLQRRKDELLAKAAEYELSDQDPIDITPDSTSGTSG